MHLYRLLLIPIIVCLSSCASQVMETKQPDWVTGNSKKFSSKQYLVGVGEADTISTAKSRARAEIAKIFSVAIETTMVDTSSYSNDELGTSQNNLAVKQEIKSKTKQLLQGVEIPKMWKDEVSQRYYALAVLPRQKARLKLNADIDQLDMGIGSLLNSIRSTDSLFEKIQRMDKAIQLQTQRDTLNAQLRVVSSLGNGKPSDLSIETLRSEYAQLLNRVSITPKTTGLRAAQLKTSLSDTLANQGYKVTDNGDYVISAALSSTALPPRDGWYYQKAILLISISGESKISLGGNQWNYKVSARDKKLSEIRVVEKATQLLNQELNEKLLKILSNE